MRGTSLPLKRAQSITPDRTTERPGKSNGVSNVAVQEHGEGVALLFKGRTKLEGGYFWKNRLVLIRVLITFMAACCLATTLMQGSIVRLLKHTDFLTLPDGNYIRDTESARVSPGVFPHCERAVWMAASSFRAHLPDKPSLEELENLGRFSRRPARLAIICPNLGSVPDSLYMITIAKFLHLLGYELEVYARKDGHLRFAWDDLGVPVNLLTVNESYKVPIDWSKFEGVIAVSLAAKKILNSLVEDPFVDIPVIWIIPEKVILKQDPGFNSSVDLKNVLDSWQEVFNRTSVVVFPNYYLPMAYREFFNEKFYVVAGSPWDVWESEHYMKTHRREDVRSKLDLSSKDFALVVIGNPCVYNGVWKEHALVMKAAASLMSAGYSLDDATFGPVRVFVLGHGNSSSPYKDALQVMAQHVGLPSGLVQHVGVDEDIHGLLWASDAVVYTSVTEEHGFPPILVRSLTFQRPVIVPDIAPMNKHISDGHNGFLFPPGDDEVLTQILWDIKNSPSRTNDIAAEGKFMAEDLNSRDAVLEYGHLLESLLDFPEDCILPRPTDKIQGLVPRGWNWDILTEFPEFPVAEENSTVKDLFFLKSETDLKPIENEFDTMDFDNNSLEEWDLLEDEEQQRVAFDSDYKDEIEEDQITDRLETLRTSFEEVSKFVKKMETRWQKDDHRERENLELERVGQPLVIYETFRGSGAWSFLHREHLLYQGLSLSTKGKRPDADDIDGQARLPLLNESYYRDVLCEFGGFFAMGNFIDRVHRNLWIGFQPWRAVSQKVALTQEAETSLIRAVNSSEDGDALYFWSQSDSQLPEDFWDMCDAVNGGNCRSVFLETWKQMYGLPSTWMRLPPMPSHGGTWSTMNCWALPTSSFLEFVRFARIFVDVLDAQHYVEHHEEGRCCLSRSKAEGQHCYCRLLEGLINVWAYHSARKMIYVDPNSGAMREQHSLQDRKGIIWAKFFQPDLLQNMDEDLAEEYDDERPNKRWIWPLTGEVFWRGSIDKERQERYRAKLEKKRRQLERQARQSKYKQKPIGKVLKTESKSGIVMRKLRHHQVSPTSL
ncbi:hypothetical protein AXG93_1921s1160 [Marchantia polymorpha subsp. ruderalis]|nr:hypothetical protein AXG93_1921s1160 [Marchantia polymorpha subsp. ruderalis]